MAPSLQSSAAIALSPEPRTAATEATSRLAPRVFPLAQPRDLSETHRARDPGDSAHSGWGDERGIGPAPVHLRERGDPNGYSPLDSVKQGLAPERRKAGSSRPFRQVL
jgi:hypothetical protein